jgi:hypothetical protein
MGIDVVCRARSRTMEETAIAFAGIALRLFLSLKVWLSPFA